MTFWKEIKKGKHHNVLILALSSLIFLQGCSKEKKERIPKQEERELVIVEQQPIDYEALTEIIVGLEEAVMQQPFVIDVRENLVAASYDSVRKAIFCVGTGRPPAEASSTALALQAAERAALLDAYRWAAYILRWKENPQTPDFGFIEGELPGGAIIHKKVLPDNKVIVLVQVGT